MPEPPRRRPEWKGERVQVNIMLSLEGRRMLRALVRRRKVPQSELVEALIRAEHAKH